MRFVAAVQSVEVDVERVRVLHDELAQPQQPGLRPRFVAELGLDLVPDLRQVLVGTDLLAGDIGEHFLVSHAEAQIPVGTVLEAKHVVAHVVPSSGFLPEIRRVQRRQKKLLRSGRIQLFADDVHDPEHGALPQRKIRVNSGGELANEAAANQQLMRGELRVRRIVTQSRNERFGPAHVRLLAVVSNYTDG